MSYNKTTWETGDIITAEKLNNLESGVENANIVDVTSVDGNLSMTFEEIQSVCAAGKLVRFVRHTSEEAVGVEATDIGLITGLTIDNGAYIVAFTDGTSATAESGDGPLVIG